MLGSRTRQVNAYGRRSSRIVNAPDRKDSSEVAPDAADVLPGPTKRGNTPIISPKRHRVGFHDFKGSNRSPRGPQLAQNQPKGTRGAPSKRIQTKAGTRIRQPLTPLRPNGPLSNDQLSAMKNAYTVKPVRTSLKPQSSVVSVDIIVLDEGGNTLTQERRLSYTEVRADPLSTLATRKGKSITKLQPSPPPMIVSDDTDPVLEISPKPLTKRRVRRHHPVIVSSDESETDENGTMHIPPVTLQHSKSRSLRVEVVIPPAPFRNPKLAKPPQSPPLALTDQWVHAPPRFSCEPIPAPAPLQFIPPYPIPKPRQLTPIRGGSGHPTFRPSPLTPLTPTEADLSLDLAQLKLFDAPEIVDTVAQPEYLAPLLNECAQISPYEFSAFIETFPFDPIVQSSVEENARFHKIGEASYSEVFGIGDVVLKIVPIRPEEEPIRSETAEIPSLSDPHDVLKEIVVTREIGGICDKYVRLLKTYVVRGKYPSLLLDLWDGYNERKGSESIRPDSFGLTQVYVIIILPNGGPDLESFTFKNASKSGWHQACGIFWQVARALEQAEGLAQFEHRDLHWGQILVKSVPIKKSASKCDSSRMAMDDTRFGVEVTIIDLGLSRMSAIGSSGSEVYWTAFDQEVFEGEGDYQYDTYRLMRDVIGGTWESFHPLTNILWLHYLATKLLCGKRLKLPGNKRQTNGETRLVSLTGYDEQDCYDCLVEMERLLGNCVALARKGQRRRKTVVATNGPKCARDVIAHGKRQGWVR